MPLVCQVTQEPMSRSMLPIQANLSVSNCALLLPNSGSSAAGAPNTPSAVPSRGAALAMKLAARTEPAPGMFCTTMFGWPGMNCGMWRASRRI